jgi:hypothetical protein
MFVGCWFSIPSIVACRSVRSIPIRDSSLSLLPASSKLAFSIVWCWNIFFSRRVYMSDRPPWFGIRDAWSWGSVCMISWWRWPETSIPIARGNITSKFCLNGPHCYYEQKSSTSSSAYMDSLLHPTHTNSRYKIKEQWDKLFRKSYRHAISFLEITGRCYIRMWESIAACWIYIT